MYSAVKPYLTSNMSSGLISNTALACINYRQAKNLTLSGQETEVTYSTGNTHTEFAVDQNSLDSAVLELFYNKK